MFHWKFYQCNTWNKTKLMLGVHVLNGINNNILYLLHILWNISIYMILFDVCLFWDNGIMLLSYSYVQNAPNYKHLNLIIDFTSHILEIDQHLTEEVRRNRLWCWLCCELTTSLQVTSITPGSYIYSVELWLGNRISLDNLVLRDCWSHFFLGRKIS